MKQCTRCGGEKPTGDFYRRSASKDGLDAWCKSCSKEYGRIYYRNNKEQVRARNDAWALSHADQVHEYQRQYRADHADDIAEYQRQYRQTHKDELSLSKKEWARANPEKRREATSAWRERNPEWVESYYDSYTKEHPEVARRAQQSRRARKAALFVEDVRHEKVWERDAGICGICGLAADPRNWHLDHIVPLSRGGEHSYANTRVTHGCCNTWKHDHLDSELPPVPERVLAKARAEALAASEQAA